MKNFIFALCALALIPTLTYAADVTFLIERLKNNRGKVYVSIYQKDGFIREGAQIKDCVSVSQMRNHTVRVRCELIPGVYAAAIYHDENDNDVLDTNFIGIPKEGYGFSNNPKLFLGAPSFEEAGFIVGDATPVIKINMTY